MILVAAVIAVPTAVVSSHRDTKYVEACNSTDYYWKYLTIKTHAIAKGYVLFSTLVMSLYGASILYSVAGKWKKGAEKIEAQEWDGENCSDFVFKKFYKLYNNYIEVGKSTCLESKALSCCFESKALSYWFALTYIMYLTFLSIQAAHILLLTGNDREDFLTDLIHSLLNVIIYILSFFFPYLAANSSHSEHDRYRKKMNDVYLNIKIDVKVEDGSMLLHTCEPGNGVFKVENYRVYGNGGYSPASLPTDTEKKRRFQEGAKEKYKEYFREASIVQGTNVLNNAMGKKEEFDFLPSLKIVNIPLNSPGYTAAIALGFVSVILSFI
jgi:hypothetical protein